MRRREFLSFIAASAALPICVNPVKVNAEPPLRLGIFPRRNVKQTYRLFAPMAVYLQKQLGRKVILETTQSFMQFWENVKNSRYDIVHFNQYHYIVSHQLYNYDVIAVNKELGQSQISGSIIVRKDSGINHVSDLKGKTILFGGGRRAMQSYISATWLLRQGGLNKGDYKEKFAINPPNTIISTYFKRADASGSGDVVMQLDNVRSRIDISKLKFLAKTKKMVHLPWALNRRLSQSLQSDISRILTELDSHDAGLQVLRSANLDALVPAIDSEFDDHRKIVTEVYGDDYGVSHLK